MSTFARTPAKPAKRDVFSEAYEYMMKQHAALMNIVFDTVPSGTHVPFTPSALTVFSLAPIGSLGVLLCAIFNAYVPWTSWIGHVIFLHVVGILFLMCLGLHSSSSIMELAYPMAKAGVPNAHGQTFRLAQRQERLCGLYALFASVMSILCGMPGFFSTLALVVYPRICFDTISRHREVENLIQTHHRDAKTKERHNFQLKQIQEFFEKQSAQKEAQMQRTQAAAQDERLHSEAKLRHRVVILESVVKYVLDQGSQPYLCMEIAQRQLRAARSEDMRSVQSAVRRLKDEHALAIQMLTRHFSVQSETLKKECAALEFHWYSAGRRDEENSQESKVKEMSKHFSEMEEKISRRTDQRVERYRSQRNEWRDVANAWQRQVVVLRRERAELVELIGASMRRPVVDDDATWEHVSRSPSPTLVGGEDGELIPMDPEDEGEVEQEEVEQGGYESELTVYADDVSSR